MAANIIIKPSETKEYFFNHANTLVKESHKIAYDKDTGIEVYLTSENDFPLLSVVSDDSTIYEMEVSEMAALPKIVEVIYDKYLTSKVFGVISGEDEEPDAEEGDYDFDEIIDERELKLDIAIEEFFYAVLEISDLDLTDKSICEAIDDCKEHFLEYMARKHNFEIYRPMFIEYDNEDGTTTEEYEEYPYGCLEFEDEDNPIYR